MEDLNELDELIQGNTAEEKLQSAKEIITGMEKDIFKLRAELKRNENSMKKLQEAVSASAQNQNNTSSAFLLPSEFKKSWEILIMENILDLFTPFLSSQIDFVILSQTLVKQIISYVDKEINCKVSAFLSLLGLNESNSDKIRKYSLKMFQDNYLTAFPCPPASKIANIFLGIVSRNVYNKAKALVETSDFENFVNNMHKLSVHMLLNDPPLDVKIPQEIEYIKIIKPDDYYYIDGFPVGNPEAILVLPCVMKGNHIYAGTKPSVLVLPEDFNKNPSPIINKKSMIEEQRSADPCVRHQSSLILNKYSEDLDSYPPLQRRKEDFTKKDCLLCKINSPCAYCSKVTLLALAKRIPNSANQRHIARVQSNSLVESPAKGKYITNALSRRLSEAAKKMDKKTFIKNKHIDKEACKVM
ncbi:hypothetical protein SteCoe_36095 [Stentor coeruleus]|uniref:Uncharacterized protein n=1 Tax=Stentor coeruleus TaxID=5963 RepID=A0A1R2AR64_9CILI|nr:hypothetical protein SteCoe_36095 [Stentor coeruleus]